MYSNFSRFGSVFKKRASVIDNPTFRLHYRFTFAILTFCGVLVSMTQFIGRPIQCMVQGVPGGIMNTYCWIHGTFTIPRQLVGILGEDMPHPGIGPLVTEREKETGHAGWNEYGDEIRHAWYQWVCFVLFIQAMLCYFPHYLWKSWEGGKISMLLQGLDDKKVIEVSSKADDKKKSVVSYFKRTLQSHDSYVYKFVFCEFLNLVNIIAQIYIMDWFFGGQFTTYGTDVLAVSEQEIESRNDPMNRVFPKVTKCIFNKYGPSGTVEVKDGLCVLALNIINEKIYIGLWFWFIFVSIFTTIHLLSRLATMASMNVRKIILSVQCKSLNGNDIKSILKKCSFGDWFLLTQMAKVIHPSIFHDLMLDLRDKLDEKRADNLYEE